MKKPRDKYEIIEDILKAAQSPASKSRISFKTNMSNYGNLQYYLDFLQERELIENNNVMYKTSKSGNAFLQKYKELESILGGKELP